MKHLTGDIDTHTHSQNWQIMSQLPVCLIVYMSHINFSELCMFFPAKCLVHGMFWLTDVYILTVAPAHLPCYWFSSLRCGGILGDTGRSCVFLRLALIDIWPLQPKAPGIIGSRRPEAACHMFHVQRQAVWHSSNQEFANVIFRPNTTYRYDLETYMPTADVIGWIDVQHFRSCPKCVSESSIDGIVCPKGVF